jgi:DNA ligase 1
MRTLWLQHLILYFWLLAVVGALPAFAQTLAATDSWQDTKPAQFELLLAKQATSSIDPQAYLVSEKYDGVRAFWDGAQFHTRNGTVLSAPDWFVRQLPKQKLDGELWLGRGQFDRVSGLLRAKRIDDVLWRSVHYMVFELPDAPGNFAERARQIEKLAAACQCQHLQAVPQRRVANAAALQQLLIEVSRQGGEGLMLHLASARYQTGRSDVLLKLKLLDDAEGTVVAHLPGKGRLKGMMGALLIELVDGKRFKIGTGFTDTLRRNPPKIGSLITFRFRGYTKNGLPRFASYWRMRDRL